jgi:hypothetical protein
MEKENIQDPGITPKQRCYIIREQVRETWNKENKANVMSWKPREGSAEEW